MIVFTEAAVWNVYSDREVVESLEGIHCLEYWGYLLQPMIFLLIVSAPTPWTRVSQAPPGTWVSGYPESDTTPRSPITHKGPKGEKNR